MFLKEVARMSRIEKIAHKITKLAEGSSEERAVVNWVGARGDLANMILDFRAKVKDLEEDHAKLLAFSEDHSISSSLLTAAFVDLRTDHQKMLRDIERVSHVLRGGVTRLEELELEQHTQNPGYPR